MRELTFKTFLEQYLRDVSGQKTLSIHKLVELSNYNKRIVDALILYCALNNKIEILKKYIDLKEFHSLENINKDNYLNNQFSNYSFIKIYQSYLRKKNTVTYDNEIKSMIREKILTIMKEKKITNYRVYKDLNANPGNINDYLKNNNVSKVSLAMAKRIYNYCLSYWNWEIKKDA